MNNKPPVRAKSKAEEEAIAKSEQEARENKRTEMVVARFIGDTEIQNVDEAWEKFRAFYTGWSRQGIAVGFILRWLREHSPQGQFLKRLQSLNIPERTARRWIERSKAIEQNKRLVTAIEGKFDELVASVAEEFSGDEEAIERANVEARKAKEEKETEREKAVKLREQVLQGQEQLREKEEEIKELKSSLSNLKDLVGEDESFANNLSANYFSKAIFLADRYRQYLDHEVKTRAEQARFIAVMRTLCLTINQFMDVYYEYIEQDCFSDASFYIDDHLKDQIQALCRLQGFRERPAILESMEGAGGIVADTLKQVQEQKAKR
jgi:hypothetical protein